MADSFSLIVSARFSRIAFDCPRIEVAAIAILDSVERILLNWVLNPIRPPGSSFLINTPGVRLALWSR